MTGEGPKQSKAVCADHPITSVFLKGILTMNNKLNRRSFLQSTAPLVGACAFSRSGWAEGYRSAIERPVFGFIGAGIRYETLVRDATPFGPAAAICDVDGAQLRRGAATLDKLYAEKSLSYLRPTLCEDYRLVLDRRDIDAVFIATPDHWHTKIAIEAMHAGKDVYCEKPMTLTIAEGQEILDAIKATGRVVQVGTHQRSGRQFQVASAMLRDGRVGNVKRVTCAIGGTPTSDPLPKCAPPSELNWNRWLGPCPYVDYCASPTLPASGYGSEYPYSRGHVHFRWWYEYGGGKVTDWGAHHMDIALWALDKSDGNVGPFQIDPLRVEHPVEFKDGYPTTGDRFNAATTFHARVTFEDGIELDLTDVASDLGMSNGIMFQGDKGRYLVNRGKLVGKPVEDLEGNPLPSGALTALHPAASATSDSDDSATATGHIRNFLDCVKSREKPLSDAWSHHRHLTVCHAVNIALRLGRKLTFDPASQTFVDDPQANEFLARERRKGFAIEV